MIVSKTFTKIYFNNDEFGYLELLFHNEEDGNALYFNGIKFIYKPFLASIPINFKILNYRTNTDYVIDSIRQDINLTLIKFLSDDIFQLYFMMDDNMSPQVLIIYERERDSLRNTPLGISLYDSVLKTYNESEECEIEVEL